MNIQTTPFPQLITERLVLRRLITTDADRLLLLRSDDLVNQHLNRPKTMNADEAVAFVKKIDSLLNDNKSFYWALSLKDSDDLIGTICLWNFKVDTEAANIGYELLPDYQGKGLMLEAVEKIIDYGFRTIGFKLITGLTHPENKASRGLLEKVGFALDKEYAYVHQNDAVGELVYYLIG